MLRETFGSKLEEKAGGWGKIQNEEFYGFFVVTKHYVGDQSDYIIWECCKNWEKRNACKILIGEVAISTK
jgi:hypothetical protein